jgi:hypothetical protein
MHVLYFVLFLLSVVCFVVAAFELYVSKINLVALGLALFAVVFAIQQARLL